MVEDNEVRWQCVGRVPRYADYGLIAARGVVTTTDNTLTTLDTYRLTDNATTQVDVIVTAYQVAGTDSPDGATFTLRGAWRYSSGDPESSRPPEVVEVRGFSILERNRNARGDEWTAMLALNGNNVEVRVRGERDKTIQWASIRQGI